MADAAKFAELDEWLRAKEGENFEFKEAKRNFEFDRLARYLGALANEGGGRVILGVTDARPRRVVGSEAFSQPERTRRGLGELIPLRIDFEEIAHPDCSPGSRVLVFSVAGRPVGTPIKVQGRYWTRKGDSLEEMSEDRLRAIFAEAGRDFSAEICTGATMQDLDAHAVADFRRRWVEKVRNTERRDLADRLAALDSRELLADADAVVDEAVTYAALILFGTERAVARHLPQAEIRFEYRTSESAGPAADSRDFRRGFFACYDELWDVVNLRNDKQDFQDGLFVTPIATFNERVVREALLNAVSHRDYQLGGSIFVRQFARRLEIDSPGGPPTGITLDNILDRQNPRNRRIAEIFTRCGLVERSGQGMNLIFEESIRQSKPVPNFARTDQYQFGLTLHGGIQDPAFIRFVEKVGRQTTSTFNTHDWLALAAIARTERLPQWLRDRSVRLLDLGLIERAGRRWGLSRKYYEFVGDRAAYTRKRGLDREQNLSLLLKHIRDNAAVGSPREELLQVVPALKETEVKSLLRTLQNRGEAHFRGQRRWARWYPGPPTGDRPE